jgi:hypothetical protein
LADSLLQQLHDGRPAAAAAAAAARRSRKVLLLLLLCSCLLLELLGDQCSTAMPTARQSNRQGARQRF